MLFKWLESLVVALLGAATSMDRVTTQACSSTQTAEIWNGIVTHNVSAHILEPSNNINCGGAHLASSLLAALTGGTVKNVNIMFWSADAGLLEVEYEFLPTNGTAWQNCPKKRKVPLTAWKTLWNDDGPDLGQHLLSHTGLVTAPANFTQNGWRHYDNDHGNIPEIRAICEAAMASENCLPPARIPGRRAAAPRLVVEHQVGTNRWLSCIVLVLDDTPNRPPLPPLPSNVTVYARSCYPVKVPGRPNGTSPLDPLPSGTGFPGPGDPC